MKNILETFHLSKCYGKKRALEDVSLALAQGRLIGLLGPNGSGKTTLIKLTAGLLVPTSGQVLVDGLRPGPAAKQRIAYLPDRMALPAEFRAADAVAFYKDFFADFDAAKASAMLSDLKLDTKQRIGAMSKGTQEKVQLCLTMSRGAKLYLLDEPLGGVDPAAREYILQTILRNYSEDSTVLLSTHLVGDIEKALDEVVFLREGRLMGHQAVDALREEQGMSVDEYFREVFR